MVTWYIQVYGLGKVGLFVPQSLHGWHTQDHRSKGVRASYFGRPYCAVILKSSGFRCKVDSVSKRFMVTRVGFDLSMCSSMGWFVYVIRYRARCIDIQV